MNEKVIFSIDSNRTKDTEELGAKFGKYLSDNNLFDCFVALYGDLGAGKTAFIRGVASVIAPESSVCSPTYTIVNEYGNGKKRLYHFDMYRITGEDDLFSIGFYDYRGILAVEWCEKIPFALPDNYLKVEITKTGENSRHIEITEVNK